MIWNRSIKGTCSHEIPEEVRVCRMDGGECYWFQAEGTL